MRLLFVLSLAGLLSGCTALMVGGGKTGAGQQSSCSSGYGTSERATTTAINSKLRKDALVSAYRIGVATCANRVTLRGNVGSRSARDRAHEIAAGESGVIAVDNQIRVTP